MSNVPGHWGVYLLNPKELPKPTKTYFFKRRDGSVFSCSVKEAAAIKHAHTLVGVSSGVEYINRLKEALEEQTATLEGLGFNYDTARSNIEDLMKKVKTKKVLQELDRKNRKALQEAAEVELKAAEGHLEVIPNLDVMDINGGMLQPASLGGFR